MLSGFSEYKKILFLRFPAVSLIFQFRNKAVNMQSELEGVFFINYFGGVIKSQNFECNLKKICSSSLVIICKPSTVT